MARNQRMPPGHVVRVHELVVSAMSLEPGPAKVAVLEEAVRVADAHNDEELAFEVRQELIQAATFGGSPEVAMVAFAWCLAMFDKYPDRIDAFQLLWRYKWILDSVPDYPQIGRKQIADMFADMERRYRAAGSGMHPVHQTVREVYRLMGDLPAATAAHANVLLCDRDPLSNCPACEQHAQVKFYLDTGRTATALRMAEPIVAGQVSCAEVPHSTYSYLLLPLVFAGRPDTAAEYHRKGTRLIGTNPKFLAQAARHLVFLTLTDNLTAATKYLEVHLPNGVTSTCPAWRFDFDRAAVFLLDRLAGLKTPPRVRFPANLALPPGVDPKDPAALRDYFAREARELAEAFDARNGNDRFRQLLAELADLEKRITPYKV
jgi:hypothetical protein